MKYFIIVLLTILSAQSYAAEVSMDIEPENVRSLRIHTMEHTYSPTRRLALLFIDGLGNGCPKGVYLDTQEQGETMSMILAAKIAKSAIRIGFEPTKKSPWGDSSVCALTYFDIK